MPTEYAFDLKVEGTQVTGAIRTTGQTTPIHDGLIDGNTIRFKVTSPSGERIITFVGTLDGDRILFTRDVEVRPGGAPGGAATSLMNAIVSPLSLPAHVIVRALSGVITLKRTPGSQVRMVRYELLNISAGTRTVSSGSERLEASNSEVRTSNPYHWSLGPTLWIGTPVNTLQYVTGPLPCALQSATQS